MFLPFSKVEKMEYIWDFKTNLKYRDYIEKHDSANTKFYKTLC
jgi:hypothetical protein